MTEYIKSLDGFNFYTDIFVFFVNISIITQLFHELGKLFLRIEENISINFFISSITILFTFFHTAKINFNLKYFISRRIFHCFLMSLFSLFIGFITYHYYYEFFNIDYKILYKSFLIEANEIYEFTNILSFATPALLNLTTDLFNNIDDFSSQLPKQYNNNNIPNKGKKQRSIILTKDQELFGQLMMEVLLILSFALIVTTFYIITKRLAKLDCKFKKRVLETTQYSNSESEMKANYLIYSQVTNMTNLKLILNIFIFIALFNPLLKDLITVSDGFFYFFSLQTLIVTESLISIYLLRIYANFSFSSSYVETIWNLERNEDKHSVLNYMNNVIPEKNLKFFETFIQALYYSYFTFLPYLIFWTKSNYFIFVNDMVKKKVSVFEAFSFKQSFLEVLAFNFVYAISFCKCILYYAFYLYNFYFNPYNFKFLKN